MCIKGFFPFAPVIFTDLMMVLKLAVKFHRGQIGPLCKKMTTNYVHAHMHILSVLIPHFLCQGFAIFGILCYQALNTVSGITRNGSSMFIHAITYSTLQLHSLPLLTRCCVFSVS